MLGIVVIHWLTEISRYDKEWATFFRPLTMQAHELKASPVKSAIEAIKKLACSMEKETWLMLSLLIVIRYGLSTGPNWSHYDVQWYNEIA